MTRLTIDHHFRPTDRELSRVAALRYARHHRPEPRPTRTPSPLAWLRRRSAEASRTPSVPTGPAHVVQELS